MILVRRVLIRIFAPYGGIIMAYKCHCCGKGTVTGNNVSHSNRKTRRTWKPNLKSIRIQEEGKVKKVKVCTRCLRSSKVKKAV